MALALLNAVTAEVDFETNGKSMSVSAGSDRLAIVFISSESSNDELNVSSATLGGQTLTVLSSRITSVSGINSSGFHNINWVGYLNDSQISSMSGSAVGINWTITPNNTYGTTHVHTQSWSGVDQTTPFSDNSVASTGAAFSINIGTVAIAANEETLVYDVIGQHQSGFDLEGVADASYTEQVQLWGATNGFNCASFRRNATTADAAHAPQFDAAGENRRIVAAMVLKEASGGGGGGGIEILRRRREGY